MRTRQIISELQRTTIKVERLRRSLEETRGRRRIRCACNKTHALNQLKLIVTHWYHEPHGCTGGDYWSEGEWNFIAPCGLRGRFMFDDWSVKYEERGTIDVAAEPTFKSIYRHVFASRESEYKDSHERSVSFNCYDMDLNRKRFELPAKPAK